MLFQMGALIAGGIAMMLIMTVVMIFLSGLFLMVSARLFKLKDKTYKTALIVAAITGVVSFILGLVPFLNIIGWILALLLGLYLVKQYYKLDWSKAALVWIVWVVISWIAMYILGFIVGAGMFAAMM